MYKLENDVHIELAIISSLVMKNLKDIQDGCSVNFGPPLIEKEEAHSLINLLKAYKNTGENLLEQWSENKYLSFFGFYEKLESYIKYLVIFSDDPTIGNYLKMSSVYDSLYELSLEPGFSIPELTKILKSTNIRF